LKENPPFVGNQSGPIRVVVSHRGESQMSVVRLIHITLDPSETEKAMRVWKTECAPLMIQQKGCISEKLLRCRDAHEFISYSEWDSEADIATYLASDAHKEIFATPVVSKDQRRL
jgi:heme-degrading monooxygenase HmoA